MADDKFYFAEFLKHSKHTFQGNESRRILENFFLNGYFENYVKNLQKKI